LRKCYDILCYHTMVGSLWGTDSYFRQGGYSGTESHFGVGYDGQILQWQDTRYRADANLDGGDRVLSVETADMGPGFPAWSGSNVPKWTAAQIEANARIAAWAHKTHGIPLVIIPNSAQSSRGLGWHRQGIDPWRCATCERWSSASGKVCPGDRRVAQMPLVLNRAIQIRDGLGDDDMATPEELWEDYRVKSGPQQGDVPITVLAEASTFARNAELGVVKANQQVAAPADQVAELAAKVDALVAVPPGSTVVSGLTDESLAAIAAAVAAEQGRRLTAPPA
jgi:N-acetylmuramoyl-L-alanine amidase